jgi:hypothetical protein
VPHNVIDIIIPVYNQFDVVKTCIDSVIETFPLNNFEVVVVRDRVGEGSERIRFSSAILPPYARRSKSLESADPDPLPEGRLDRRLR